MNRDDLQRWAEREGVSLENRNLTNKGLESGKIDRDTMRRVNNQQNLITTVMKELPNDGKKLDPREEMALRERAQREYARREFNRVLAAKEIVQKNPERWWELPKVGIRDVDLSTGPNIVLK